MTRLQRILYRHTSRRKAIAASVAAALAICALPTTAVAKPTILLSGSTSMYPMIVPLAQSYSANAKFKVLQGGSDIGIADVARGRVTIGLSSRDPQPSDPGGLAFTKVARDGVCLVTNPSNPVGNLSQAQVQQIFSGRIRSWSQIPGARVSGPIDLIVRTAASGTQDAFKNIFLGQDINVAGSAAQKPSNGLVQQAVRSNKNAIGYVSFDFSRGLWAVPYMGVGCTLRAAKSGAYPGTRNFWMVTRGKPGGAAKSFIDYVKTSSTARRIIATDWVPLR
ncbi:MAG: phosphate ABC transporter substrate-binding protein [Actinomycetota bacterium]